LFVSLCFFWSFDLSSTLVFLLVWRFLLVLLAFLVRPLASIPSFAMPSGEVPAYYVFALWCCWLLIALLRLLLPRLLFDLWLKVRVVWPVPLFTLWSVFAAVGRGASATAGVVAFGRGPATSVFAQPSFRFFLLGLFSLG